MTTLACEPSALFSTMSPLNTPSPMKSTPVPVSSRVWSDPPVAVPVLYSTVLASKASWAFSKVAVSPTVTPPPRVSFPAVDIIVG